MITRTQRAAIRAHFERWKMQLYVKPSLEKLERGKYKHTGVQREFVAYVNAIDSVLPSKPPKGVLEVIAAQGVREAWCEDVYKAVREHMISELESKQ